MQNVIEILKELGIEVPEDKTAALNGRVAENYRTIADYNKQTAKITRAEEERDGLRGQLSAANETIEGFKGVDLDTINKQLEEYRQRAENAEKEYRAKLEARDLEDALKTAFEGVKFTSEAAKSAIMAEVRDKGLKLSEGKLLGFDDAIAQIKARDASAFLDEQNPPARFTAPLGGVPGGVKFSDMTLADKMKFANEHPDDAAVREWLGT